MALAESGLTHPDAGLYAGRVFGGRMVANGICLLVSDTVVLLLGLVVGDAILEYLRGVPFTIDRGFAIIPVWWAGAVVMRIVPGWGMSPSDLLRRTEVLLAAIFGIVLLAAFLLRIGPGLSRISILLAYAISAAGIPLARAVVRSILIRRRSWGVSAAVYGRGDSVGHVIDAMRDEPGLGYCPIGVFGDVRVDGTVRDVPVLGGEDGHTPHASVAIMVLDDLDSARIPHMISGPLSRYAKVVLIPSLREIPTVSVRPQDFLGLLGLEIVDNLANPLARLAKRILDLTIVLLAVPVWLPLLSLIALIVKLDDRGPAFYVQERIGHGRKRFRILKFRTMRMDAERLLETKLGGDPGWRALWEKNCKMRDDPRVTRVGRILRMTSLDELPQLFNVLAGTMALVGPRPLPEYHYLKLSETVRDLREEVLPGLTGMWQVSGRSETGTAGMERWDAYYVRNWSVWLDLLILGRTLGIVFSCRGAY